MTTIKLPIQIESSEARALIADQRRIFSSCVRYSYNRFLEGKTEKEIRALTKEKFKIGSWLVQSAIGVAHFLYRANSGERTVVFGGKYNRKQYLAGKISKEEFKANRLEPLCSIGEKPCLGNRFFKLEIENRQVVYKPNKDTRVEIKLPKLRKKMKKKLQTVEELAKQKKLPVMFKLSDTHIFISFDEVVFQEETPSKQLRNRILGIDLNPNYIGVSVIEFAKDSSLQILHKEVIDLAKLMKKLGLSNKDSKQKKQNRKLNFEQLQCIQRIVKLAKHYQCAKISAEDLSAGISTGNKKGKHLNRLINNQWHVQKLLANLKKHCVIANIELVEVNPAYSSFVGNIQYGSRACPDPIAASIEIARRGFKKYSKEWFYPVKKNVDNLEDLWKKKLDWSSFNWKELFSLAKESKVKYRFSLEDASLPELLRLQSWKSNVARYRFI